MSAGVIPTLLRVIGVAGFASTLVGAGFVVLYASLVEGSYEVAVRAEPWEWVRLAAYVGGVAAAVAIGGLAAPWRAAVSLGAVTQGMAAIIVLALAVPNFESSRSDFERIFIAATALVLTFDAAVLLTAWASRHRRLLAPPTLQER